MTTLIKKVNPELVFKAYELGKRRGSWLSSYATNEEGTKIFVPNPGDGNGITVCEDGSSFFGERPDDLFGVDMSDLLAIAREKC